MFHTSIILTKSNALKIFFRKFIAHKLKCNGQFTPTTPTRLNSTAELSRVVDVNWP